MSRPYNKQRGRGGGRGNIGRGVLQENCVAPGGRGGGRGGGGCGRLNRKNVIQSGNRGNGSGNSSVSVTSVMTTLLDLLFQKSSEAIFDPQSGMLNLSRFHESPDLASVQQSVDFSSVAFCKSLANVIKNRIGTSLRILALNDNKIQKLGSFLTALEEADVHSGVTAISATGNNISDFAFLGPLKKYTNLAELLLIGNPVTKRNEYRAQVVKSLPKILMLDNQLVDRALLRLPNPVAVSLAGAQVGVLQFLETAMFAAAAAGDYDALVNLYNPNAVCSVSRAEEPIPRRLPLDSAHNSHVLTAAQRNIMNNDFAILRKSIQWRNLHNEIHSIRHVALGRAKASVAIQTIGGGSKRFFSVSHELNGNANVVFLSQNMKVQTCVLTIHGKMNWYWSPKNSDGTDVFPRCSAPFLTCFFDRTMSLVLDAASATWSIVNDMVFLRPDRTVMHDDGTASSPLFFANEAPRVEALRRRYLPRATREVMQEVIEHLTSDAEVQAFLTGHLATLPGDRVELAMTDRNAMISLLKG